MRRLLVVLIIFLSAKSFAIGPSSVNTDFGGPRPSCEMLAWRWVNTLARFSEREKILQSLQKNADYTTLRVLAQRVPGGAPEESEGMVTQKISFKIPGANQSNLKVIEINTPTVQWKNVAENLTDLVSMEVQAGVIKVASSLSYADYCFAQRASRIHLELGGKPLVLSWSTRGLDVSKYLKLLEQR